ncbi:hypothetical protein GCM10010317_058110 [Streptomyces mirabilis]|nr:hypothetical protein GCM10010317_058110 [Streptomyces mirabilis]
MGTESRQARMRIRGEFGECGRGTEREGADGAHRKPGPGTGNWITTKANNRAEAAADGGVIICRGQSRESGANPELTRSGKGDGRGNTKPLEAGHM